MKQPHAERLASGAKRVEYRTWKVGTMGPLLIVASKTPDLEAYEELRLMPETHPRGVAIAVVDLWKITGDDGDWHWHVRSPRRVVHFPVRGYAAIYAVDDALIRFRRR